MRRQSRARGRAPGCPQALSCSGLCSHVAASPGPSSAWPGPGEQVSPWLGARPTHSPAAPRVSVFMSLLLRFDFVPDETMTPNYTRSDRAWRRAGGNSPDRGCTARLLYWALGQALPALTAAGDSARFPDGETDMGFLGEPTMRCSGWYPLLGLHTCRGCLKHLRKSGRCLSHVWELLSPPGQESSVLLAAGLTFLVWVLPWVHCNGVCFPSCPGPWEAQSQTTVCFHLCGSMVCTSEP